MILSPLWPVSTMAGPWHELDADLVPDLKDRLRDGGRFAKSIGDVDQIKEFRIRPLPFWPDWMWLEALFEGKPGDAAVASALYGPHGVHILDGTSSLVHDINDLGHLLLSSAEMVCEYLRFFCSAVRGDSGPFYIIESLARFQELTFAFDIPEAVVELARPLNARRSPQGWRLEGLVLYGGDLFHSVFSVSKSGLVEMMDDKQVDVESCEAVIEFDGLLYRQRKIGWA